MQHDPQSTQLPEAMDVADIGPYLRSLREHYKLSIAEVATRLHMRTKYIEAIEESRFDALPNLVYARGHVGSYAEFLGLNPKQVTDKCFGEKPTKSQPLFVPAPAQRAPRPSGKSWMVGLIAVLLGVAGYEFFADSPPTTMNENAPQIMADMNDFNAVPEDMLQQTRQLLMPTAVRKACLLDGSILSCLSLNRLLVANALQSLITQDFIRQQAVRNPS